MTKKELFDTIITRFTAQPEVKELIGNKVTIKTNSMTMDEALLIRDRRDFPNLSGKEVMIDAEFMDHHGQAFTDAPSAWAGSFEELLKMDFENDPNTRGLLIASINAVMGYLGKCNRTTHCKADGPKECACKILSEIENNYKGKKILLVGFQPFITNKFSEAGIDFKVLDLNPDNIGKEFYGKTIFDGGDKKLMQEFIGWADLVLCTGSTVCNGTLVDYLDTGKETIFFGSTISGTAGLLGLKRLCFADEV